MIGVSLFLIFYLCILITGTTDAHPQCEKSALDWWNEDVKRGQRAYLLQIQENQNHGVTFHCMAKGDNSEMMDPVVKNDVIQAMFSQKSQMPCAFISDEFGATYDASTSDGTTATCGVFDSDGCSYPKESEGQVDWGGPTLKISMVNDFHTTVDEETGKARESPYNNVYSDIDHSTVFGTPGTYCQLSEDTFLYTSSLSLSTQTLDNMKYKVYAFATEDERLAALNDPRNVGLEYATEMKGESGCDVEILYEFKPKTGGGLRVVPSLSYPIWWDEVERAEDTRKLLDSSTAYMNEGTAVATMSVEKRVVRETQYLPPQECDNGSLSSLKFSTQFVCKSTQQRVNITSIEYKGADGILVSISADPNNPTRYQDPNNYISNPENDPDLFIELSEADAPESCEWMYWDPLIASMPGDGQGVQNIRSSYLILIVSICAGVVVLASVGYFMYIRSSRKVAENAGSIEADPKYEQANSGADPESALEIGNNRAEL
eukprot:GSChrysophyteH2.ASY1.ANO1.743.1 assembled CDS